MDEIRESLELELEGYLQKKSTKGFYNNRYFATKCNYLRYWSDKNGFLRGDKESECYDISKVDQIEKCANKVFVLYFLGEVFKLDLKANSEEHFREWTELLKAKRSLYSVDELISDLRVNRLSFRTKTFQTLMVLSEKDQNKFILDRLDDIFEVNPVENSDRSTPVAVFKCASRCIEEMRTVCGECMIEMTHRDPKVLAHSRAFIRRYASIIKGRTSLEILSFLSTSHKVFAAEKRLEQLGDASLCAAIEFMEKVESLRMYEFIPKDFIATLQSTLFSQGELVSAMINLSLVRIDALFAANAELPPLQRSLKLIEFESVFCNALAAISLDTDSPFFVILLQKIVTAQFIGFADQLNEYELQLYDESSLLVHMDSCEKLVQLLSDIAFDLVRKKVVRGAATHHHQKNDESILFFPNDARECVLSSCKRSAQMAAIQTVSVTDHGLDKLLPGLFVESSVGWIGGDLCTAILGRLEAWVSAIKLQLLPQYVAIVDGEICQLLVYKYFSQLIKRYSERKGIRLTGKGMKQLDSDLSVIRSWITNKSIADAALCGSGTSALHNKTADGKRSNNVHDNEYSKWLFCSAGEELILVSGLLDLHQCSEAYALEHFASMAVAFWGIHVDALFDLTRLILKFRSDISSSARNRILGQCIGFCLQMQQLSFSSVTNSNLQTAQFSLDFGFSVSNQNKFIRAANLTKYCILDLICPAAGRMHCTGKKWNPHIEKNAHDAAANMLAVANQVTASFGEMHNNMKLHFHDNVKAETSSTSQVFSGATATSTDAGVAIKYEQQNTETVLAQQHLQTKEQRNESDKDIKQSHSMRIKPPKPIPSVRLATAATASAAAPFLSDGAMKQANSSSYVDSKASPVAVFSFRDDSSTSSCRDAAAIFDSPIATAANTSENAIVQNDDASKPARPPPPRSPSPPAVAPSSSSSSGGGGDHSTTAVGGVGSSRPRPPPPSTPLPVHRRKSESSSNSSSVNSISDGSTDTSSCAVLVATHPVIFNAFQGGVSAASIKSSSTVHAQNGLYQHQPVHVSPPPGVVGDSINATYDTSNDACASAVQVQPLLVTVKPPKPPRRASIAS